MVLVHDEKSKGDRRVIASLLMLFIGIVMGVSLMSIIKVGDDADERLEEYAKKKKEGKNEK